MKLVPYFAVQLNTRLVRICMFFDYPLMVGSARNQSCPAFAETPVPAIWRRLRPITSFFQPVKIKQLKKLKLRNVMHKMTLNWRGVEGISCKTVSTYRVEFGPPPPPPHPATKNSWIRPANLISSGIKFDKSTASESNFWIKFGIQSTSSCQSRTKFSIFRSHVTILTTRGNAIPPGS